MIYFVAMEDFITEAHLTDPSKRLNDADGLNTIIRGFNVEKNGGSTWCPVYVVFDPKLKREEPVGGVKMPMHVA